MKLLKKPLWMGIKISTLSKKCFNLEPLEGIHQKSFTLLETSLLKDYGNMLVCHPKIGSSYPKSCTWKAQIHYQQISLIRPYWKSNQSEWSSYLSKNKIFGTKQKNPVKLDWIRKVWYLLLRAFWLLLPKFNFWMGNWALGMSPPKFEIFLIFPYFLRS